MGSGISREGRPQSWVRGLEKAREARAGPLGALGEGSAPIVIHLPCCPHFSQPQADPQPTDPDPARTLSPIVMAMANLSHVLMLGWIPALRSSLLSSLQPLHPSLGLPQRTHSSHPGTQPGPRSGKRASWSGSGLGPGAPSAPPGEEKRPAHR